MLNDDFSLYDNSWKLGITIRYNQALLTIFKQLEYIMNVNVEISIGEFFDKLTILEIKSERISDPDKLVNINNELDSLNLLLTQQLFKRDDVTDEVAALKEVNEELWVIEDDIREKESNKTFDDEFVELARSVYITNDKRSDIKREINLKLGSDFVEEKSYEEYQ